MSPESGPRAGKTKCQAWSRFELYSLKICLKRSFIKKICRWQKHAKFLITQLTERVHQVSPQTQVSNSGPCDPLFVFLSLWVSEPNISDKKSIAPDKEILLV